MKMALGDPTRVLIYQILNEMSREEIDSFCRALVIARHADPDDVQFADDRKHLCSFLASKKIVSFENLSQLKSLFDSIKRYDICRRITWHQLQVVHDRIEDAILQTVTALLVRERWILSRIFVFFLLVPCIWHTYSQTYTWTVLNAFWYICLAVEVYMGLRIVRFIHYKVRFFKCSWGCIKNSYMSFRYTTYDLQEVDVVDNIEFEWDVLAHRLNLPFQPRQFQSRYFLNTNRCIMGDAQKCSNSMDGVKPVRGAEVFAVEPGGRVIYYESKGKWHPYNSACNIKLHTSMEYGFSWLKGYI